MLKIIWSFFIIFSFIFSIIKGNINELNQGIFNSAEQAVNMAISLMGTICLWSGIINIIQKTSIIKKINKILEPLMKVLFPRISKKEQVYNEISMNISANMLGLGNAATPMGIKAMESLNKNNKNKNIISDEMMMFIILNTASVQIIPTTVIAIRASLGANNPADIIIPIWITTIIADLFGIILVKVLRKK